MSSEKTNTMKTFQTKHGVVRIKWTTVRGWTAYLKGRKIDCSLPQHPEALQPGDLDWMLSRHLKALEDYEKIKS